MEGHRFESPLALFSVEVSPLNLTHFILTIFEREREREREIERCALVVKKTVKIIVLYSPLEKQRVKKRKIRK